MRLDAMKPAPGSRRAPKRVGRGPGSGLGKTSGKGHKGARARAGFVDKPGFEGGQMPMQRRLPKRGFSNHSRVEYQVVNLRDLERFEAGSVVDAAALARKGLASVRRPIKILAKGKLGRGLTVCANAFSASARQAIEAAGGKIEIVGRHHRRDAGLAHELQKLLEHPLGGWRIEISGRLVGEQHFGIVGDGAGNRHALLFAAGKLCRAMIPALVEAESFELLFGPRLGLVAAQTENELWEHDVLERRELRQKMMELIDEAHFHATHAGLVVVGQLAAIDAFDEHGARVGALEKARDVEQGRLAGARRPKQCDGFTWEEGGCDALQYIDTAIALGISALKPLETKHR